MRAGTGGPQTSESKKGKPLNWLLGDSGNVSPVDYLRPHRHRTPASKVVAQAQKNMGAAEALGRSTPGDLEGCPMLCKGNLEGPPTTHTLGLGVSSAFVNGLYVPELVASTLEASVSLLCFPLYRTKLSIRRRSHRA